MRKEVAWGLGVIIQMALGAGCGTAHFNRLPGSDGGDPFGIGGAGGGPNGGGVGDGGGPSGIVTTDKLDLLLMIDNSSSMADKQQVFATVLPDLVQRLSGVSDLHVGVITSSLGGHGHTVCEETEERNDHAELLASRPRGATYGLPDGFIAWTPAEGASTLANKVQSLVIAAGEAGCGLEAQLESVYRFLADPFPPKSIVLQGSPPRAAPQGIDDLILAQRAAFLRRDSAVAVVLLSDENDCSIRDSDQFYYAAVLDGLLPQASTVCGTNPNDPCCYSCGLSVPRGCAPDPKCGPPPPSLTPIDDQPNLRCFEQKRRFGIDFLYPIERYVNALKKPRLCTTLTDLDASAGTCPNRADGTSGEAANPLYEGGSAGRDPSMVYMLGIVGVPWQLIASDAASPSALAFKTAQDMLADNTWSQILGDPTPANSSPPIFPNDPHMQESVDPRPGLPGPNSSPTSDPIHGHEWSVAKRDDLQYACIFRLPTARPCVSTACDCFSRSPGENNPLCANPAGQYESTQYAAKAYPGIRELAVIKGLGKGGVVASICPVQLADPSSNDFGYRAAMAALATAVSNSVK